MEGSSSALSTSTNTGTALLLPSEHPPATTSDVIKIQLHERYILTKLKSGILLIDQQTAHERILYEQYLHPLVNNQQRSAQPLLFPVHIPLNPTDMALLQAHITDIHALGFTLGAFGKDSLIITGCPTEAADHDLKQLLEGLIEQFKWNQAHLSLNTQENLARSLAKRACIQPGKRLQEEEINALVDQLFACTHPSYTPDGRKTFLVMTLVQIKALFQE